MKQTSEPSAAANRKEPLVTYKVQFSPPKRSVVASPKKVAPPASPPKKKGKKSSILPGGGSYYLAPSECVVDERRANQIDIVTQNYAPQLNSSPSRGNVLVSSSNVSSSYNVKAYETEPRNRANVDPHNKFRNLELEKATRSIQEEFNRILREGQAMASPGRGSPNRVREEMKMDDFYKVMGESYNSPEMKRHQSPTKRLIAQKNSTSNHKKLMKGLKSQDYSLHYTSSPGKSYVIEPKGGELDYDLARRDPATFYDQVITQEVSQHKAKDLRSAEGRRQIDITSKLTHRKISKVLNSVQDKMKQYLASEKGFTAAQLNAAFNDTSVKKVIQKHMLEENIQLVHENQPVYRKAMTKIGREGARALNESPNAGEETAQHVSVEPEHANLVSRFHCLTVSHICAAHERRRLRRRAEASERIH